MAGNSKRVPYGYSIQPVHGQYSAITITGKTNRKASSDVLCIPSFISHITV